MANAVYDPAVVSEWMEQQLYGLYTELGSAKARATALLSVRSWPARPAAGPAGLVALLAPPTAPPPPPHPPGQRRVQQPDYYSSRRRGRGR